MDGFSQPWHFVHYGGFAKGGAGLVMLEATAVSPEGRISPQDLGIWNHQQAESLRPLIDFIHAQGSVSCIQLAHAGRKASTAVPWKGRGWISEREGGWQPLGPSKISFNEMSGIPKEMATEDLERVKRNFIDAAFRCHEVGVQSIEIHAAHGYLMHQFLSPVSNHRNDKYGGSLENRMRFPLEVVQAVRKVWPEDKPLFVRLS